MLSVIKLSVIMLSVVMLSVIMLSVMAPSTHWCRDICPNANCPNKNSNFLLRILSKPFSKNLLMPSVFDQSIQLATSHHVTTFNSQ
jgi:hypothetical protein